jgi:hypothetical protein
MQKKGLSLSPYSPILSMPLHPLKNRYAKDFKPVLEYLRGGLDKLDARVFMFGGAGV